MLVRDWCSEVWSSELVGAQSPGPDRPPVALAVLTDYEQIPRFLPDIKTSVVRERAPGRVVVEQEAVAHMLMFSKRVRLLLEITGDAGSDLGRCLDPAHHPRRRLDAGYPLFQRPTSGQGATFSRNHAAGGFS